MTRAEAFAQAADILLDAAERIQREDAQAVAVTDDWTREEMEFEHSRCGSVRPGTLGYQMCRLESGHDGDHRSQDRKRWARRDEQAVAS